MRSAVNFYLDNSLAEHAELLSEQVEPILDALVQANSEEDSVVFLEGVRTLLRRSRTWGSEPTFFFELHMRLGDNIAIPARYEPEIMRVATLLAQQAQDISILMQAIQTLEELLNHLTASEPPLFEAALLYELADLRLDFPADHPLRDPAQIEAYYREALPAYQEAKRQISVALLQHSIGDVLSEQGRYEEALESLQFASQGLQEQEAYQHALSWVLSSLGSVLANLDRAEEARAAYTRAIALQPEAAPLLRNRAETLIHLRRLAEAEADLARAVELDGDEERPYLWFRRAQLALARGDSALAEQMLGEVIQRDPTHDVALARAQSAWLRGEQEDAQEWLQQTLKSTRPASQAIIWRDLAQLQKEHPALPPLSPVRKDE